MSQAKTVTYGMHAVSALLETSPEQVKVLYLLKTANVAQKFAQIIQLAEQQGLHVEYVQRSALDKLAANQHHQGVVAWQKNQAQKYNEADLFDLLQSSGDQAWLLVLDGVEDPHNLGACLRTAAAAGITAVVAAKDRAAPLSAVAKKVASGAAESVPYIQVTNLARTLETLKERGFWLTGLAGEASRSLYQIDLNGKQVIIMGAEGKGLRRLTREKCDFLAHIPMLGNISSLNVSVATGVCLFEAVRQRTLK